jgi:diphosphomevalonate decarboxylase
MDTKNKADIVKIILNYRKKEIYKSAGEAFAPANIALCKYWGKRNKELHLPVTSSLSLSLSGKGTRTKISLIPGSFDRIFLNGNHVALDTEFAKRVIHYLDLFRLSANMHFLIDTANNIPTSVGLGSSASGFAALIQALDDLFMWELDKISLSILARLGSGSACRSLWQGFVKWKAGRELDGMDSFARVLPFVWPKLRIGLLVVSQEPKKISSQEAMSRTIGTSPFYQMWPQKVFKDIEAIEHAIARQNFRLFGQIIESNALSMHACMTTAWPPIIYSAPNTISAIHKIWQLRVEGLPIYFTQDAGPNLNLFFLERSEQEVRREFPDMEIVEPFEYLKAKS